ncbi:MAG TPA: potassium transporter TrkG [Cytophagales bacterium]|nr:potassium transporter TrkG [Cytophagales bacterium]
MKKIGFFENLRRPGKSLLLAIDKFHFILSICFLLIIIYDTGFEFNDAKKLFFKDLYLLYISIFSTIILFKIIILSLKKEYKKIRRFDIGIMIFALGILIFNILIKEVDPRPWYIDIISESTSLRIFIVFIFFASLSKYLLQAQVAFTNPTLLFVSSFLVLILVGTFLLLLPAATNHSLSIIDAFFTSTSAVCVTGLVVVDTATYFTDFGKHIILFLIQVGGLGIMTFSTFIGFIFTGSSHIRTSIHMKEFVMEERIGKILSTIGKIYLFTLSIELIGAFFIWTSIKNNPVFTPIQAIDFSIFHSISAFCNAGFSTLPNGLYEESLRFNYNLHWVISFLIIIGGIGFPVMFNLSNTFLHFFINKYNHLFKNKIYLHQSRHLNVHTKLVLITTFFLLLLGFFAFLFAEYNNILKDLSVWGKISTSFFGSVSPRTAGFNTFDMESLTVATVLIYMLLMWIGASPASTGGGLKTTTFAVAILNTISISKNKDRIEVFGREISSESVRRALAVFVLSFLVIGIGVFSIMSFNPELAVINVAFECFSAFSTVGLTIGVTHNLAAPSKIVLIILMFLGRVGTLTILIGIISDVKALNYRYPTENVHII